MITSSFLHAKDEVLNNEQFVARSPEQRNRDQGALSRWSDPFSPIVGGSSGYGNDPGSIRSRVPDGIRHENGSIDHRSDRSKCPRDVLWHRAHHLFRDPVASPIVSLFCVRREFSFRQPVLCPALIRQGKHPFVPRHGRTCGCRGHARNAFSNAHNGQPGEFSSL